MKDYNTITPDQMRAWGLPPLELAWRGSYHTTLFPEPSIPLSYSGPPGGPDKLYLQIVRVDPAAAPFSLDDELKKNDRPNQDFIMGEWAEIDVGERIFQVRCWSTQVTPWLDSVATTMIPVTEFSTVVLITLTVWKDSNNRLMTHQA